MTRVLLLVEGQTEERFVKSLLASHLGHLNIQAIPIIVATKRLLTGEKRRGGYVPYPRLRSELLRLLADSNAACVTTMLDFYGLAPEFPGRQSPVGRTPLEKVRFVEQAWAQDINCQRFLPYLALHEYEAMLFASPPEIARILGRPSLEAEVLAIRRTFESPEDINDNEATAPSKRLARLFPTYNKPFYGERIAESIGLQRIRRECAHFAEWLAKLESIADQRDPP